MGATSSAVVINEVFPNGTSATTDPDWAELKNNSKSAVDLTGYKVRDNSVANLYKLPDGTKIEAGGYIVIYCDDIKDGGVQGGIHVPFKLSSSKGDEFHFVAPDGNDADSTTCPAGLPAGMAWSRIPDGTGPFAANKSTKGAANQ